MSLSKIQWTERGGRMDLTGFTREGWYSRRLSGEKWCTACKDWHPVGSFGSDTGRSDGLAARCRASRSTGRPRGWSAQPKINPLTGKAGPVPAAPRDGDKKQARARVNREVRTGYRPRPGSLPCVDCGHVGADRRHEYDHFLGYGASNHGDVEAVCSRCHHARERGRARPVNATEISWTDATWNPVRGCSRISEGCRHCYAEGIAARFSGPGRPFAGFAVPRKGGASRWTGRVELVPEKLREPLSWRKPVRVFVNSMSDLFHESLPDEAIDQVFAVMALAPQHTFQVLTKRADRMRRWFGRNATGATREQAVCSATRALEWPGWPLPNVWLGVSVEDQRAADERIPHLLQTPAAVRFVSAEPLLGPVNLRCVAPQDDWWTDALDTPDPSRRLDWVIVGGESGPRARACDVAWVRSIVEQCKAAGVACFVKQLGSRAWAMTPWRDEPWPEHVGIERAEEDGCAHAYTLKLLDPKGGDPAEWPLDIRVREFPGARA